MECIGGGARVRRVLHVWNHFPHRKIDHWLISTGMELASVLRCVHGVTRHLPLAGSEKLLPSLAL